MYRALARGVRHICEEFVLGLPPQNRQDPKWRWHWADEGNLAALSQMLKIQLHIFSVTPVSFNVAKYQPDDTNVVIGLLHHGGHYDVLFV